MIRVLDSHALLLFLEKEEGYEKIQKILFSAVEKDEPLLMTSVDYGDFYTVVLRECTKEKVEELELTFSNLPIRVVDIDAILSREAAKLRAEKKISLANSFAAALTKLRRGELITADKEFKSLESDIKISWVI